MYWPVLIFLLLDVSPLTASVRPHLTVPVTWELKFIKGWKQLCKIGTDEKCQQRMNCRKHFQSSEPFLKWTWSKTLQLRILRSEREIAELHSSTAVGAQGLVRSSGFRNLGWVLQKARLTCESPSMKPKEIRKSLFIHSLIHSFIHQPLTELEMEEDLRMLYIIKVISLQSQLTPSRVFNTL